MIVRRRGQKSLAKIYKDLMITKRELTDLRESIAQTLFDLKQPMPKYSTATRNKKICFSCGATLEPALPHQCRAAPKKAPLTKQFLKNNERNSRNLQQRLNDDHYYQCQLCLERHFENQQIHEAELCGHVRLNCEHCGSKIKRKDLSEHILCCCFHSCPKCKKSVYFKTYSYHACKCSLQTEDSVYKANDMMRTRRMSKDSIKSPYAGKKYYPCGILK